MRPLGLRRSIYYRHMPLAYNWQPYKGYLRAPLRASQGDRNNIPYIIILFTYTNSFIVIVPGYINHSFLHCFTQQYAFLFVFQVLLQVFNNKGYFEGVPFIVYFLTSSYLASNTAYPLYEFIKDKTFSLIIIYNFHILFAILY